MKGHYQQSISLLLRALITLCLLAFIIQRIEWPTLLLLASQLHTGWLALAFVTFGAAFFAAALRWYFLLNIQGIPLPLLTVARLTMIGAFFNAFLLGSTGGDMAKLVYVFKHYPQLKAQATLSILMDRILGLVILLIIAMVFIAIKLPIFLTMPAMHTVIGVIALSLAILLFMAFLLLLVPIQKIPPTLIHLWQKVPGQKLAHTLLHAFRQHRYQRTRFIYAALCSTIVQLLVFFAAFLLAQAIALPVSFFNMVIVITIVTCIISLPISIGGHGLREGAFLLMFGLINTGNPATLPFNHEIVVLFSLLYFLLGIGWSVVGGIIYLLSGSLMPATITDQPD